MERKNIKDLLRETHFAVPEIQREYVWGNKETIVRQFLEDLNRNASAITDGGVRESNVGFLYSYERFPGKTAEADGTQEFYLIDGQQRLTTLLLLAFCLAVRAGEKEKFTELLETDAMLPRFSYRVRSLTDRFLIALWQHITKWSELADVRNQTWNVSAYENDPTVKAMIATIGFIHKFVEDKASNCGLTFDYCVEQVYFWYFNVAHTSQGEELYISMNSRGEQLTDAEQIKPLLFQKARGTAASDGTSWGKAWDNWEEFFFTGKAADANIEVVDESMDRFVRIVVELNSLSQHDNLVSAKDIDHVSLPDLERAFEVLKLRVAPAFPEEFRRFMGYNLGDEVISDGRFLQLKALIAGFTGGFGRRKTPISERDTKRLYHLVRSALRCDVIDHVPFLKFLNAFTASDLPLYEFIIAADDSLLEDVFDAYARHMVRIFHDTNDTALEDLVWEAEDDSYLQGDISGLWVERLDPDNETATANTHWTEADRERLKKRFETYKKIFDRKQTERLLSKAPSETEIDNHLIARTIFACYGPYGVGVGGRNVCYGYSDYWTDIFTDYPKALSTLLDRLENTEENLREAMERLIDEGIAQYDRGEKQKNGQYYIIKYPDSLRALNEGYNILRFEEGDWWENYAIDILNKTRASSYNINLFVYLVYKHLTDRAHIENEWLEMDNGLQLWVGKEHGWQIYWEQGASQKQIQAWEEKLSEALHCKLENRSDGEEPYFFLPVPEQDDLIQSGIEIVERIRDLAI